MTETNRKWLENVKRVSFRRQVVDPYVEQMDLKQTVEMQKTIINCENKSFYIIVLIYITTGIIAGIIAGWIWLMDYLGFFPYVTGDSDPFFLGLLVLIPITTYFGYQLALDDFKISLRKRIMNIAGVKDGEKE